MAKLRKTFGNALEHETTNQVEANIEGEQQRLSRGIAQSNQRACCNYKDPRTARIAGESCVLSRIHMVLDMTSSAKIP